MRTTINILNTPLFQKISVFKEKQFSGELQIKSPRGIDWRLYFCLGRLFWVDGGEAIQQSWHRHLIKYFPQLEPQYLPAIEANSCHCDRYQTLAKYLAEDLVSFQQVKDLIQNKIEEILFDILQQETYHALEYNSEITDSSTEKVSCMLAKPLTLINPEEALGESQKAWALWVEKGLGFWSPHLVVTITNSRVTLASIAPRLLDLLNGKNTLRDIAFLTGDNLIELSSSLVTYVHKGLLQFIEVAEEEKKEKQQKKTLSNGPNLNQETVLTNNGSPLIVAIDNNSEFCKSQGQIIEAAGYRFISIEDSWQAIPRLVSYQPDAILLTAKMPIVNGYEILAQLRRVPHLKHKPVIMITDNILANLRAKLVPEVQANISKPIVGAKLLATIKKLLSTNWLEKYNRSLRKYRGVSYTIPRKRYNLYLSKSYTNKLNKKYRGLSYSEPMKEVLFVDDLEDNFDNNTDSNCNETNLFACKYEGVTYSEQ